MFQANSESGSVRPPRNQQLSISMSTGPSPLTDTSATTATEAAGSTSTTCPSLLTPPPFRIPEILTYILSTLSKPQLAACSTVSRAWKDAAIPLLWAHVDNPPRGPDFDTLLAKNGHYVVYLDLYFVNTRAFVPPAHVYLSKILSLTPNVRHLYLTSSYPGQGAGPAVLADASNKVSTVLSVIKDTVASQLIGLRLDIGDLSEQDARRFFPTLKAIHELELIGCRQHMVDAVVDSGLRHLVKVVCLVGAGTASGVYTTGDSVFGDETIEELGRSFPGLQDLSIFNNYRITLTGLTGFVYHCKTLTRFQLQCCPYVGSDGISALIKASTGLTHLSLGHSSAHDSVLMDLASSPERASRLLSLSVSFSPLITTAGIRAIVDSCFNLEELDFELCPRVTLDIFSEPAWVCLGLKVLNMSNIHGGSASSVDGRRARSGLHPMLTLAYPYIDSGLKDMYQQLSRLSKLRELDMCGLPFHLDLLSKGRDAVEGLKRLRILRLSEQTFPLELQDVIWLATRLPSLRWLELSDESIRNQFRTMLMEVNMNIQIFIVGKRNHFRRALQRRHQHPESPIPDPPSATFTGNWMYDDGEEEDEQGQDLGGDFSNENGPTSPGGITNDEAQGMDEQEHGDQQVHIDYQFSPPYPPDTDSDAVEDNGDGNEEAEPDVSGANLMYSFGGVTHPTDCRGYLDIGDDQSEDESDYGVEEPMEPVDEEPYEPDDEEPYEPDDEEPYEPDDEEPYEPDNEEPYEPDDEEPYELDDEEAYEPDNEELCKTEGIEDDETPSWPSEMNWSGKVQAEQNGEEEEDFDEHAYHAAQAEAVFIVQQAKEEFYEERSIEAYEMEDDHPIAQDKYECEHFQNQDDHLVELAEQEFDLEQDHPVAQAEQEYEEEQAHLQDQAGRLAHPSLLMFYDELEDDEHHYTSEDDDICQDEGLSELETVDMWSQDGNSDYEEDYNDKHNDQIEYGSDEEQDNEGMEVELNKSIRLRDLAFAGIDHFFDSDEGPQSDDDDARGAADRDDSDYIKDDSSDCEYSSGEDEDGETYDLSVEVEVSSEAIVQDDSGDDGGSDEELQRSLLSA